MEESIIDHVLISEDFEKELESITIDEKRNNSLVKIVKSKSGIKKIMSDHNPIISKFNISWCRQVYNERVEMFNLKNRVCQSKFKDLTSKSGVLSSAFKDNIDFLTCTTNFIKKVNQCIQK